MTTEHIVITQHIITVPDRTSSDGVGFDTVYSWDGQRFPDRGVAVEHGFEVAMSDDFNVAVLDDGRLTWFGWMDQQLPDYPLREIAEKIGVKA
jgi:hypothetical protein